ncbi:MAG: helix-turn-helix domain-containing protein, partial [Burkholderiales bacterium]
FSKLLLQYTHTLIRQIARTAVCNRYHTIEEQSCRWMLLMLDRLPSDQLSLTHESLSRILGVRREGVTAAAGKLQKAGVIRYRRRHITVLNSLELKKRACECYALGNQETQGQSCLVLPARGAGVLNVAK